jgi:arylsulfatase
VETGFSPIQKLATPHMHNLTVNPDENTPYNYELNHSWALYDVYGPLTLQLIGSLAEDSIPAGAPADHEPHAEQEQSNHPLIEKLGDFFHAR